MNITQTAPPNMMQNAQGHFVPVEQVKDHEKLEDQTVKALIDRALGVSKSLADFKASAFEDVAEFQALLSEKYNVARGGKKGNVTLMSYDGCMKVSVQVSDNQHFGPELQVAKEKFDICISKWAEGANANIHALVDHAFQVDKEGRINRTALFGLRRLEIDDDDWKDAIAALNDSIKIIGSKEYIRFHRRDTPRGEWKPILLDLASVTATDTETSPAEDTAA